MRTESEPHPPLLAKLTLLIGIALLGLEFDEPKENAVHSVLQWMFGRHNDFEPFVLLGISAHDFSTFVAFSRAPPKLQ